MSTERVRKQRGHEAEKLFQASFNATLDRNRQLLTQVGAGQPDLPNENFDTGAITGPGKYRLNDETHAKLLDALAKESFSGASLEVRAELLEFYGHPDAPYATKRKPKDWAKVQAELEQLKKVTPPAVPTPAVGPLQPGLSPGVRGSSSVFSQPWRVRLYVGDTACNRVQLNSRPER